MAMEGLSTWDTEPGQWYRYNGKERDTLSGWTDFGARWGVLEIGRWNGVDPLADNYYGWSPFCFTLNNPISFVDPDGRSVDGDIYNKKGVHIGNDGKNDQRVIVANTDSNEQLTQKHSLQLTQLHDHAKAYTWQEGGGGLTELSITHKNFLDRANWVYGEGGGNYADHYAHAIKNLREHGPSGRVPYASDEEMFKKSIKHEVNGVTETLYPEYFTAASVNPSSGSFAKLRSNPRSLESSKKMTASIAAVIGSLTGSTKDPTNGAYQWVGGSGERGGIAKNPARNNATNVTNVNHTSNGKLYYHTFYSNAKE